MTKNELQKIYFKNFWKHFDDNNNFFRSALVASNFKGEIQITSVFPNAVSQTFKRAVGKLGLNNVPKIRNNSNLRRVWYTGENIRPPYSDAFDAFISFDQDDYFGKNIYFPIFYSDLLFGEMDSNRSVGAPPFEVSSLIRPRILSTEKNGFVCAFINNPEPTRLRAIDALSKFGKVDVFGKYSGKPVERKYDIARRYKYVLCFENDLYPGYVTEKLLDAYLCETVPLYMGNFGSEKHINRRALVNAADFSSLEKFANFVSHLENQGYEEIYSEPLLNSVPKADELLKALTGNYI